MTARRKADRGALALRVAELAGEHRIEARYRAEVPETRQARVDLAAGHCLRLTVKFDGADPNPDVYLLSWHGVEDGWRLNPDAFGSVNSYHGRKATDVAHGAAALLDLLRRRFAAIADGTAFAADTA